MSGVPPLFGETMALAGEIIARLEKTPAADPRWRQLWPAAFGRVNAAGEVNGLVLVDTVVEICKSPAELDAAVEWQRESQRREDMKRAQRRAHQETKPAAAPAPPPGRWDLERDDDPFA